MSSCNNGEIKTLNEKVDSLTKSNVELQKELDGYKHGSAENVLKIAQNKVDLIVI